MSIDDFLSFIFTQKEIMFILSAILGSCFASFMNEFYFRYQPNQSALSFFYAVFLRPSRCAYCQQKLIFWQLIPVFSWVFQKGKTKCCHQPLSLLYVVTEFCCGILVGCLMIYCGASLQLFVFIALLFLMMPLSLIDLRYFLIPDFFHVLLIALALTTFCLESLEINSSFSILFYIEPLFSGLLAYLLLAVPRGLYLLRYKKETMGKGDLKLAFSLGLFLPLTFIPYFILLASFLGFLIFTVLYFRSWMKLKSNLKLKQKLIKLKRRTILIPFAPALCLSQLGLMAKLLF